MSNLIVGRHEYEVLSGAGKVSADSAKKIAESDFEKFRTIQDKHFKSDFDKVVDKIKTDRKIPPG